MSLFAIETKGRVTVRGIVNSFTTVDTVHGCWTKMLVTDYRDFKVYGTVPSNILAKVKEGDEVEFCCKLQIKTPHYAQYKNPTKGSITNANR